jgi:hypothetical protein
MFSSLTVEVNNFMLVVLYCCMRKFRACAPSERYLLCTLSAEMCQCTKSGNVCVLCPFCTQTNCRRTVYVFCQLGWNTARKVYRSARVCLRSAYTLISFQYRIPCFVSTPIWCSQSIKPRRGGNVKLECVQDIHF